MFEIYDAKLKKYVIVLETEDNYSSQEDEDSYNWNLIEEEETNLPKK